MPESEAKSTAKGSPHRLPTMHWIVGGATILVVILGGWLIYAQLLAPRGPFSWDEATHALKGVLFAHSIRNGQWLALLFDSYRQVLYPPFHSLVTAIFFLVLEPSVQSAGLVSLVSLVLLTPVLYTAAHYLREDNQVVAGVVAAILPLSSPLLVSFATQAMLEIPALLVLSVTILIYLKLMRDRAKPRAYAWLGVAVAITYFARIQYGVLAFIAIAIAMVLEAWLDHHTLIHRRTLWFLIPLILILGLWFAYFPKLFSTLGWLVNSPNMSDPYSTSGWLFYPQATVRLSGSLLMFGLYLLVTVISMVKFGRNRRIRFLLVLLWAQMLLGIFHHNRQDRYIFPILPPIFLLTGFMIAEVWSWARVRNNTLSSLLRWGLAALVLAPAGSLFVSTLQQPPVRVDRTWEAAEQVAQVIQQAETPLVIGTKDMHRPMPPLLDWFLVVEAELLEAPQAGSITQVEEERRLVELVPRLPLPQWLADQLNLVLTRASAPQTVRTLYLGLPGRASYSQSPQGFRNFFQTTYSGEAAAEKIIVITPQTSRRAYPIEPILPMLESTGLKIVDTVPVDSGNLRIDVYAR